MAASQETVLGTHTNRAASITVKKTVRGSGEDTIVAFIADITLTDGTALRSAFANGSFSKSARETVPSMAKNNNAILAINGDYSSFRMNGIVVSNGTSYLDKGSRPGLALLRDGSATLYDETRTSASRLISDGVWQTQSYGPVLVENGEIPNGIDTYEVGDFGPVPSGGVGSIQGERARTGIGYISQNHFVMIVVDGSATDHSRGASMTEFAEMFVDADARLAYNLMASGGMATMYFDGAIVNQPRYGTASPTGDILYIAK